MNLISDIFFEDKWNDDSEVLLYLYCLLFFGSQIDFNYRNSISQGILRFYKYSVVNCTNSANQSNSGVLNGNDDWIYHLDVIKNILCEACGIDRQKYLEHEASAVDNLVTV